MFGDCIPPLVVISEDVKSESCNMLVCLGEECDRSPEKVMEYLGYKSMNDPLFEADKTIKRLQRLVP